MDEDAVVTRPNMNLERITIAPLGPDDGEQVEELFVLAQQRVEPGFLASRESDEYARLLSRDDALILGAWLGGTLVGYSACHRIYRHPYPAVSFLDGLDPEKCIVYHGAGTVIAAGHEGRLLSRRMFLARHDELLRRGAGHFLGLIAVGNRLSLGNAVHAGGLLIGLVDDATALNYVAYAGNLAPGSVLSPDLFSDWSDILAHMRLFDEGMIVTGLKAVRSADQGVRGRSYQFLFSRVGQCGISTKET